jgi:flagellar hook-associated protein 1
MSLSTILSTAYTGLSTSQAVIRSISNNIANVNTPGYAREAVQLTNLVYGSNQAGVKIERIERVADQFLERAVQGAASDRGRAEALKAFHDRLQGILGRPDSEGSLSALMDRVFASAADLATEPTDDVRRRAYVGDISRFTSEIQRLSADIQQLRSDASGQISEKISVINEALQTIHRVNPQIVRELALGGNVGALQQQRATALDTISKLMDVSTIDMGDGSIAVQTTSGVVLTDRNLYQLEYPASSFAVAESTFPPVRVIQRNTDGTTLVAATLDGALRSGSIKGLMELRDQDLPRLADSLGELARSFADELNRVHNQSTTIPPPNSLVGRNTGLLGTDALASSGRTSFAVTNASGQVVATTTLDFSSPPGASLSAVLAAANAGLGGAGTLSLTNGKLAFQATNPAHGVVIVDDPANPFSRGGRGFAHYFGMNDLVTSKEPAHFQTGVQGGQPHGFTPGGTAEFQLRDSNNRTVASMTLTIGGTSYNDILAQLNNPTTGLGVFANFSLDANGELKIANTSNWPEGSLRVLSDSTSRGATGVPISGFFGLQVGRQAAFARDIEVRSEVEANPRKLALGRYDFGLAVGATMAGAGDRRGANALRDVSQAVVDFDSAGNLAATRSALSQYAGLFLGDAALLAQRADLTREDAVALHDTVTKRRDDFAGVNLDEELGNMIVFQNSYSASARLITTAREMYDTLLQIAS